MPGAHFDITADNTNVISMVNDTTERFRSMARTIQGLNNGVDPFKSIEEASERLSKEIQENTKYIEKLKNEINDLTDAQQKAAASGDTGAVLKLGQQINEAAMSLQNVINETNDLKETLEGLGGDAFSKVNADIQEMFNTLADYSSRGLDLSNPQKAAIQLNEEIKEGNKLIKEYQDSINELSEKQREAVISGDKNAVVEYSKEIQELRDLLKDTTTVVGQASQAVSFLRNNLDTSSLSGLALEMANAQQKIQDAQAVLESLGNVNLSNAHAQFKALANAIDKNNEKIEDYEKELHELEKAQEKAFNAGNFSEADNLSAQIIKVADSIQHLREENEKYTDTQEIVRQGVKSLTEEADKQEGVMVKLLGGQKNYNEIISNLPGPLRNAVTGLNNMTKAAKAFIATPLGAALAALILAYKALTTWLNKTSEGQEKLARITGYFSGVLAGLQQVVMNVGKALYNMFTNPKEVAKTFTDFVIGRFKAILSASSKLTEAFNHLFKLEFKDAGASFKDAFNTLIDGSVADKVADTIKGINDIGKAESDLNARRDKLRRERIAWQEQEGELDKKIAEQRNKLYVGSQAERNQAAAKMMDLINEKYDKQIEFAREEYNIRKESNALTDSSLELLEEEAGLNKQVLELEAQKESAKRMALRVENSSNMSALRSNEQMAQYNEKRREMFESLIEANEAAEREGVAITISSMKEGYEREKAELEHEQKDRLLQLDKQAKERLEKIEELQKAEYKQLHGTTTGFVLNMDDPMYQKAEEVNVAERENEIKRQQLERADFEKHVLDTRNENRWAYLQKYGDYKAKELAITERYDTLIERADDEFEKKLLGKEKEQALYDLQRQYSDAFSFIFADAQALTNNQLVKAIEYTQQAIKDAASDGNIEALSQLYDHLRQQLSVQASRNRNWGFRGLVDSIRKRALADLWETEADLLAEEDEREYAEDIQKLRADALQLRKDLEDGIKNSVNEIATAFSGLGEVLQSFEGSFGTIGDTLAEIGSGFSFIGSQASTWQTMLDANVTSTQLLTSGISGAVSLLSMVGAQIGKNKQAQDNWNKSIDEADQKLRMLKLDALDYQQQNLFGVENPYKKAIDGAYQYAKAMEDLQGLQRKLQEGQVQTDTKKAIDWGNVIKGAGAGALAGGALGGGVFSWLTAGIGAAIGAVVGAVSTKVVPVMEDLTSVYGRLWDDQYNLSDELIANYDHLDDKTKQIVDNWDEIKNKAIEAEKAMEENFSNLAGSLGTDLSSALSEAFRNGELDSAIDSFHDKVTTTIEDIVEQMVFSTIFSDMFDDLQNEMKASFGIGGDQNIVDDLIRFDSTWKQGLEDYKEQMEAAQEYLESAGYDVFKNPDATRQRVASTKASLGASQESIDESNGRLTAIQGHTYEINENVRRLAAAAGVLGGAMPVDMSTQTLANDYAPAIAEIKLAIITQAQQLSEMGLAVSTIRSDVTNMLTATRQIEDNSTVSRDNSIRMRTDLEIMVDKGVTML